MIYMHEIFILRYTFWSETWSQLGSTYQSRKLDSPPALPAKNREPILRLDASRLE